MPNIICPKCSSTLAIGDESVGQMVQCGSCQNVFKSVVAPPPSKRPKKRDEEDDDDDENEPPNKRKRSKRDDDNDDEDDRPRKKKKGRKHYHDDDEDDEEDALARSTSNGMATASLVLGIIALVLELPSFGGTIFGTACCPFCGILFWPGHGIAGVLALIGVILGILAMKKPGGKGSWMAGLILSGISLILLIISILLTLLGFAYVASTMPTGPAGGQQINQPYSPPPPQPIKPRNRL